MTIDLNADVGESFGAYTLGQDSELLRLVSSANIACGFHAGDPRVMEHTVSLAVKESVALGAHPGYPDLAGFGRRSLACSEDEAYNGVLYQIGALRIFAEAAGGVLSHVKPHGALYNDAAKDFSRARGIARAVRDAKGDLVLIGPPGSELAHAAEDQGIRYACEFFADRAYEDDGSLVSRSRTGAVIEDETECVHRVLRVIEDGKVLSIHGKEIPIQAETICLHGDNPRAVAFAARLVQALVDRGIAIRSLAGR